MAESSAIAVAALQAALGERAGDAVRHSIELRESKIPWTLFAAEIDDRDLGEIAIAPNQVTEVFEIRHYGLRDSKNAASAIMSLSDRLATTGFMNWTPTPRRASFLMSLSWRYM